MTRVFSFPPAVQVTARLAVLLMLTGAMIGTVNPRTAAAEEAAAAAMPQGETILVLIRTGLLTLNDALQTDNFTVLNAMGAPGFAQGNPPDKLKAVFASLKGMDLSAVATMAPKLTQAPAIANNQLRITGVFPGQPIGVAFDLLFQPVGGKWRMFGIAVKPVTMTVAAAPAKQQDAASAAPAEAAALAGTKAAKGKKKKAAAAAAAEPAAP
jgi:hypothetical protein